MASTFSAYTSNLFKPSPKLVNNTRRQASHVSAHIQRDEGMWSRQDVFEANLSVLEKRIIELKTKEKLERCCRCKNGWNYSSDYNNKFRRQRQVSQLYDLSGLVFATFGFTCLSATIFLCMVSLIIRLNH